MNNKILTLLGFAAKAGRLSYGLETCKASIKDKKAFLVITAKDVSDKTRKEAEFFAGKANIRNITLTDIDIFTLSNAVGRKCGVIAVNDGGFADACLIEWEKSQTI